MQLSSMPTQNTRLHIARKVNFAIQLLREAAELMEASHKTTPTRLPHYPRRQERDAYACRQPSGCRHSRC
jgi:hypothetical protein